MRLSQRQQAATRERRESAGLAGEPRVVFRDRDVIVDSRRHTIREVMLLSKSREVAVSGTLL